MMKTKSVFAVYAPFQPLNAADGAYGVFRYYPF